MADITGIFPGKSPAAPLVLLLMAEDEGENVNSLAREMTAADFTFATIGHISWNNDMTPWPAGKVFRGGSDFSGNAGEFLQELEGKIYPRIIEESGICPEYTCIAGYSLGGLFAFWTLHKTSLFRRAVCCSSSFWYPGFADFAASGEFCGKVDHLYFSLGNTEKLTRNAAMSCVQDCTEMIVKKCREKNIPTDWVLEEGNHFFQPARRIARGIAAVLR